LAKNCHLYYKDQPKCHSLKIFYVTLASGLEQHALRILLAVAKTAFYRLRTDCNLGIA